MSSQQVSRRALAQGVAWTVPVAAVTVIAAPAFAVSGAAPSGVITSICSCGSDATGRTFRISVTFTNTIATSFDLTDLSVATGNLSLRPVSPTTATVAAGPGSTVLAFTFTRTNGSSATPVSLTYTAKNNSNGLTSAPMTTAPFTSPVAACSDPTC